MLVNARERYEDEERKKKAKKAPPPKRPLATKRRPRG
jgi:hypothetical protein